ncbi:MAG TPA: hypothetical protein VFK24_10290 [Gammaproteobacteria bacterium]|nr:hypothetical protein [Gammaproteobacteria bacterium]
MNKILNFVILALLLSALAGCAFIRTPGMRANWLKEHPWVAKLTPHIADDIAAGKITVGMTKEEVKASWGEPCCAVYVPSIVRSPYGDRWYYQLGASSVGTFIYFSPDGKVVDIVSGH